MHYVVNLGKRRFGDGGLVESALIMALIGAVPGVYLLLRRHRKVHGREK